MAVALLVVDGMNVIGSRPDGWWRDRDGAVRKLVARLQAYAEDGQRDVILVLDGHEVAGAPAGQRGRLAVRYGAGVSADDRIVELVGDLARHRDIEVITSDRELLARVTARGVSLGSPSALLRALDQ